MGRRGGSAGQMAARGGTCCCGGLYGGHAQCGEHASMHVWPSWMLRSAAACKHGLWASPTLRGRLQQNPCAKEPPSGVLQGRGAW
eukprot:366332-Chlamydomonas_euryale.AAC.8